MQQLLHVKSQGEVSGGGLFSVMAVRPLMNFGKKLFHFCLFVEFNNSTIQQFNNSTIQHEGFSKIVKPYLFQNFRMDLLFDNRNISLLAIHIKIIKLISDLDKLIIGS